MRDITLKELLEAGCHFGHQTNRWQPKAAAYIYGFRDGVHIIDLVKTRDGLIRAAGFLKELAKSGGTVVFVGTKRQAKAIVEDSAKKVRQLSNLGDLSKTQNFYFLLERWPGGFLTNFDILKRNNLEAIVRLKEEIGENRFVTKKERLLAQRKLDRYEKLYGGLVGLTKVPDAIFLVDIRKEKGAVHEAQRTGVKMVAITDTNVNPEPIEYAIPANDDAVGSIKIIVEYMAEAWKEGLSEAVKSEALNPKSQTNSKS